MSLQIYLPKELIAAQAHIIDVKSKNYTENLTE